MTDVPPAEQIAILRDLVSRFEKNGVCAQSDDYELAAMRAVLAALESVPAMLAVIEAAQNLVHLVPPVVAEAIRKTERYGYPLRDLLIAANDLNTAVPALNKALAALPAQPQEDK